MPRLYALAVPLALTAVAGCTTHADRLQDIRANYHSGNLAGAKAKIDEGIAKNGREGDVLKLDRAMVLLTEGRPREAEALLREVRDRFEDKEGKDMAEGALSLLTDDQQLAYAGEDHEKVLIRVMLALCNLMADGSDAAAYALQANQKQQLIIEKSKSTDKDGKNLKANYKLVPAGAYLHAALREETHTNYDDVARSLELVAKWQPDFAPIKQDLERARSGHHSKPGHGVVYVFALVGRGPYKEEKSEIATTAALLIADRILSAAGKQSVPPTLAPIKVPRVVRPINSVACVNVNVAGNGGGRTQTITDVGQMAAEQCDALLPDTLARAVVRRVVKKGIVYGVKEAAGVDKSMGASLALNAAGVIWEATESADTRCWGLLPDKIQVLRLELPAGEHTMSLQPMGKSGQHIGAAEGIKVQVRDGRNTYLLGNFPDAKLAGKLVTNGTLPATK
ncbi:MAG: COG3014 family protein [Gemmata sp.]